MGSGIGGNEGDAVCTHLFDSHPLVLTRYPNLALKVCGYKAGFAHAEEARARLGVPH